MNRGLQEVTVHPSLVLCDVLFCRADDNDTPYDLRCILPPGHKGRHLPEWRQVP